MPPARRLSLALLALLVAAGSACDRAAPAPAPGAGANGASGTTAAASAAASIPADTVRVDGSAGVMPLVEALAREYQSVQPGALVVVASGLGSKARVDALAEGSIDIAMASHGVDLPELARRGLAAHEIARVAVVFAVDSSTAVRTVTEQQVCDIYAGRSTNWRQLGGADMAIVALARPAGEVDADVVAAGLACFPAAGALRAARTLEQPDEMAEALATTRGAIGMTSMPFVERSEGRMRALALGGVVPSAQNVLDGTHRLTRQSFLLIRGTPSPAVANFLTFIASEAGARVIAANAAVPLS